MRIEGRFFDRQGGEDIGLLPVNCRDAGNRFGAVQSDAVMLNPTQFRQSAFGRESGVAGVQAGAHDAIQDQRHEADRCMGADAFRQSMIDRADLDFGFEDAESDTPQQDVNN